MLQSPFSFLMYILNMSRRLRISSRLILSYSRLQEMRANLLAFLTKSHIQNPEQVLDQVSNLDPTASSGKYLLTPWVINQIVNKTIIWPEDQARVQSAINWWWGSKQKLQPNQRQLNRTITLHDLEDWQETLQPTRRETIREHKTKGAEVLFNKPPYTLLKITTPEAAAIYGRGTRWCTTEAETCSMYLKDGPLYILQKDGLAYLQASLGSSPQIRQADDREATKNQNITMVNLMEKAWVEIPASFKIEVAPYTLNSEDIHVIASDAASAYHYAVYVVEGRFPEGEAVLSRFPLHAAMYARDALKGQFPAGESSIARDSEASYVYAKTVIKGKFPAGEPAIARNAKTSCGYAMVIDSRFPLGEEAISEDGLSSFSYAINVIKEPFPEGEPAMLKAGFGHEYARAVLHHPSPNSWVYERMQELGL